MHTIFITGTGTGIGKTLIAAIVAQALDADYWKPVQAGLSDGTDSEAVKNWLSNGDARVLPEVYRLSMPASPHIAARAENITISIENICKAVSQKKRNLIIEGAGGLMVPLNETQFVADLVKALGCKVLLVSRNYLGSINHSILTASVARQYHLPVIGWVFNDQYLDYENEISQWTNYPRLGSVPLTDKITASFVAEQALLLKEPLTKLLW